MKSNKGREWKKKDNKKWRKEKRASELSRRYGISQEQHDWIKTFSLDCCYVCLTTEDLCIDHDHESGLVRGFLCRKHNTALGMFGDSLEGLEIAIQYLKTVHCRNPDGHGIYDEQERNLFQVTGRVRDRPGDESRL
jgi:hypothetical protein